MADNIPDFDKMTPEEVMAWMESLAKRQGATEGFTTSADMDIAEIDPNSVQIDEPGYVPFGEESSAKKAQPAPSKPAAASPPPPAKPAAAPARPAAAQTPPPTPATPVRPAASLPTPEPVARPAAALPLDTEPEQDTQPAGELSGLAWLESLAADQSFDFPQIDLSSLSAEIEPAPLPAAEPSNPIDWLESLTEAQDEPIEVQSEAAPVPDELADVTDPLAAGIDPMLWLESLARRQGARAEELTTPANVNVPVPKDAVDTGPGYTDYTVEKDQPRVAPKAQPEPAAMTDPNAWLASIVSAGTEVEAPEEEKPSRMTDQQIRDALARGADIPREEMEAFLDRQLTRQLEGADLPTPEDYDPNAPAVPAELPDWLLEQVTPPTTAPRPTTELPALLDQIVEPPAVEDLPDWLKEEAPDSTELESIFESEPEVPRAAAAPPVIDMSDPWVEAFNEELEMAGSDKVPEWYQRNLNDPKRIAAVEGMARGGSASLDDEPLAPETELAPGEPQEVPDWLSETASEDVTVPDWITAAEDQPVPVAEAAVDVELPDWLREVDPTITPEEIPDWLRGTEEQIVIVEQPSAAPVFTPTVSVPAPEPERSPAPMPVPVAVDVPAALNSAREKYKGGDLNGSLLEYESVIRANTALEAVVSDVSKMVEQHKDNPAVYRVLGDGLMRMGKLQAALDTYRKALNQL